MFLSLNAVKKYVNFDAKIHDFVEDITMSGSKVEAFEEKGKNVENVVIGKIVNMKDHEDSDHLKVCDVNVGQNENLQIVTGAKNVKEGDIVPVALHGAVLANGEKIKKGKIRGVESFGMFCGLEELGLNECYVDVLDKDGVFIFDNSFSDKLGANALESLGFVDTVVEFEITSNRPDCLSTYGLAREIAATYKLELASLKKDDLDSLKSHDKITIDNKIIEKCNLYTLSCYSDVTIEKSNDEVRHLLYSLNQKAMNNVIDATNYVLYTLGQPLHAFDLDKIEGNKIIIRYAFNDEKITLLDDKEYSLCDKDIVIADEKGAIALAGIMGGKRTAVSESTKNVALECANFDYISIRDTAKRLKLSSESSYRFSRGVDKKAYKEAITLFSDTINQKPISFEISKISDENKLAIDFDIDFINKFLGSNISLDDSIKILEKIGCTVEEKDNKKVVYAPSFRIDLLNIFDIAEEIARFYGYNVIESNNLACSQFAKRDKKEKFYQKVSSFMLQEGFSEACTHTFTSYEDLDKLNLEKDSILRDCVIINNPLGKERELLRSTAISPFLEVIKTNLAHKNSDISLFEIARVFRKGKDSKASKDTTPAIENDVLVAAIALKDDDIFYKLKAKLENLFDSLKMKNIKFTKATSDIKNNDSEVLRSISYYHPNRVAKVNDFALIGEIHPKVLQNYDIKTRVAIFEIDLSKLDFDFEDKIEFVKISTFPKVNRDLSLLCDKDIECIFIEEIIEKASDKFVEKVQFIENFYSDELGKDKKSPLYRLTLASNNSTLEENQINKSVNKIIETLAKENINLRD